jgi:hypothetical protein
MGFPGIEGLKGVDYTTPKGDNIYTIVTESARSIPDNTPALESPMGAYPCLRKF